MDRSTTAFQELIGTMRQHWANQLYPALHERFEQATQGQTPADSAQAGDADAVEEEASAGRSQ
jgi:hypothetical protein